VDNLLPQTITQLLGTFFICVSTLILICYVTPWFALMLAPISTVPGPLVSAWGERGRETAYVCLCEPERDRESNSTREKSQL
jgi:hypothetical protein